MYYVARTPKNPEFNGKVYGIQFNQGMAIISKETVSEYLGWSPEEVAAKMEADFGYEITEGGERPAVPVPVETGEPPAQGAGVKKSRKG